MCFADASFAGYGAAAYICYENNEKQKTLSFLSGKSRLDPIKQTTIPRLELTAAVTAVKLARQMVRELDDDDIKVSYYTDSVAVLRHIANERRCFPVFVANRVQIIQDFSTLEQWQDVASEVNPADAASRGISVEKFFADSLWLKGPEFLLDGDKAKCVDLKRISDFDVSSFDPEQCTCLTQSEDSTESGAVTKLCEHLSDWFRLK